MCAWQAWVGRPCAPYLWPVRGRLARPDTGKYKGRGELSFWSPRALGANGISWEGTDGEVRMLLLRLRRAGARTLNYAYRGICTSSRGRACPFWAGTTWRACGHTQPFRVRASTLTAKCFDLGFCAPRERSPHSILSRRVSSLLLMLLLLLSSFCASSSAPLTSPWSWPLAHAHLYVLTPLTLRSLCHSACCSASISPLFLPLPTYSYSSGLSSSFVRACSFLDRPSPSPSCLPHYLGLFMHNPRARV